MPSFSHAAQPTIPDLPSDGYVSEAVYWKRYYEEADAHYEWNDGYLEEKPVSDYLTSLTYYWFLALLQRFLAVQPIAVCIGLEFGFRLVLPHKITIRKPDLGIIRHDNPLPISPLDTAYKGVFDMCVEALSDSNSANKYRDQVSKKGEYAAAGVAEYFILHHEQRYQAFYTLSKQGVYIPIPPQDGVIHSLVLPGFCLRSADLEQRPSLDSLRTDPVYRAFIAPGWNAAEAQATTEALLRKQAERAYKQEEQAKRKAERAYKQEEQAKRRAERAYKQEEQAKSKAERAYKQEEQAKHKAEQALQISEQRAQRLAEQLRALGVDPDSLHL